MANTSIYAAFERMWQHIIANLGQKSDISHDHDDTYYTEPEIDTKLASKADTTHNHDSDYDAIGSATDSLNSAKSYTDSKVANLVSTEAVDTKISTHNTSTSAHNDIRDLISGLTNRLNTLADSDDTTLDQLSEIIAYIKSNKSLIDSITTSKVNVSDIVDDLTTNVSDKPLSAAQGVVIQALIDALQMGLDELKNIREDWNQNDETASDYIKNRTHWLEPAYETIVPSQSVSQHDVIVLSTLPQFVDNDFPEDPIFVIDGVSYEVSNWYDDFGENYEKLYGDSRLGSWIEGALVNQDSHPEDVPFLAMFTWYDEGYIGGNRNSVYQLRLDFPEDRTYTVEVKKRAGTVYHKLDVNYLPIDDIYNSVMDMMPIAEEATF